MNSCELAHFIYGDKPVSKFELHWTRGYDSFTYFISEHDYHKLNDQMSENLLIDMINFKYNHRSSVCMTVTN